MYTPDNGEKVKINNDNTLHLSLLVMGNYPEAENAFTLGLTPSPVKQI
jgi:hypothetical protein